MLEYDIDEASQVLARNLEAAKKALQQLDGDLLHIRDQMTTLEVSILVLGKDNFIISLPCGDWVEV